MKYHYLMDLHTHTLASVHAYSTMTENAREAKKHGLQILGSSDHGYGMKQTTEKPFWMNLAILPDYLEGVRLLRGVELNLGDEEGHVLEEDLFACTDYRIMSLHSNCYRKSGRDGEYTRAIVRALDRYPDITILGHPDDGQFALDYEEVMAACKRNHVAVEVNCASLQGHSYRKNSLENMKLYLEICKREEIPVIVDSDAHMSTLVGDFGLADDVLSMIDFPERLLVNSSWEKLEALMGREL